MRAFRVWIAVMAVMIAVSMARNVFADNWTDKKLADTKVFVIEVMRNGEEGLHYGDIAYRMPDGKTYWFSVDGNYLTAKEFMEWLNKFDEKSEHDVKELICAVRWMESWEMMDNGQIKFLKEMTPEEKAWKGVR